MSTMIQPRKIPIFILAGGFGTRLSEETSLKPKPMLEIGHIPILVHIMRWYYSFGFNDFVVCAGYRAWEIKNYFLNYEYRCNDLVIDHRENANTPPATMGKSLTQENWRVRVIDTGTDCMTGGRVARAFDLIQHEGFTDFGLTYGDGLCDADLSRELEYHQLHGRTGTVLAVRPTARFGELDVQNGDQVAGFLEKPASKQGVINGGFFFFQRSFRKYLSPDGSCILERAPLETLATDGGLRLFRHEGFWQPMDTLRDYNYLQELWDSKKAPWVRK